MKEKIYQLIKERNPWLLKENFLSKTIYTLLKKYLRYDETVFVGDHIQSMTGEEAFNWLGSEYTSNSSVEGLENIPKDGRFLICLLYTSPSPRDRQKSRMPSSA